MFSDNFVGVSESKDQLQRWCMLTVGNGGANVSKSAVMVFTRESVDGVWKWGSMFFLEYLNTRGQG